MEKIELEAKKREKLGTSKARSLRLSGAIPAIIYSKGVESISVEISYIAFEKILRSEAGHNALINLKIKDNGKLQSVPVLTHGIQRNPLNDKVIHIDFLRINMDETIKTKVPVELVGVAAGIQEGGILVQGLRDIEVKCLPGDIPSNFKVDVTQLKIGNGLHVSELKPLKGVEILTNKDEMLVTISAPTKEEVVAPAAVEAAAVPAAEGAPATAEAGKKDASAPKAEESKPKAEAKEKEKGKSKT